MGQPALGELRSRSEKEGKFHCAVSGTERSIHVGDVASIETCKRMGGERSRTADAKLTAPDTMACRPVSLPCLADSLRPPESVQPTEGRRKGNTIFD